MLAVLTLPAQGAVEWVHWFNTARLHSMLDYYTPAEIEAAHYAQTQTAAAA